MLAFKSTLAHNQAMRRAINTPQKALSHVHARSYWGEMDASPLIAWLNSKRRPAGDPVEKLIEMNGSLLIDVTPEDIRSYLERLVRVTKLAVAPAVAGIDPGRWEVDWRMVGSMDPDQGLALVKLLHLADKGLIDRIRKCRKKSCSRWFYAKFEHQRFHSERCQQETFKADLSWKKKRREYMKRLRADRRLQEQQWKRAKGKGKR
jgi:hypothetical protein